MIEKLGDRVTDLVEPRPIQIAKYDPLPSLAPRGFNAAHLLVELLPALAVEN